MPRRPAPDSFFHLRSLLRKALPAVKSGHIAEALASSLGFRSCIALKTSVREGKAAIPSFGEGAAARFADRLISLGAKVRVEAAGSVFSTCLSRYLDELGNVVAGDGPGIGTGGGTPAGFREAAIGLTVDLDTLGYSKIHIDQIRRMRKKPFGVNIVSGPTGSDKSTTLQRALSNLMREKRGQVNVITINDPAEYVITGAESTPGEPDSAVQYVMRRVCPHCSLKVEDAESSGLCRQGMVSVLRRIGGVSRTSKVRVADPLGCSRCTKPGYAGREVVSANNVLPKLFDGFLDPRDVERKFASLDTFEALGFPFP